MSSKLPHTRTLKKLGLTVSALLLGNPLLGIASPAQALPSWLNLGGVRLSDVTRTAQGTSTTRQSTTTQRSTTAPATTSPQNLNDVRFSCQVVNGQYTVMYNPQSQPGKYYPWASPSALGGGWSPDRRCNEISRRLEFYRPDGLLELQTGVENGYNTVCVTTEAVSSCRIVLTVPPGENPVAIRDRIFNNLLVADSGQQTTAVTAYQGGDNGILNQIGQAIGVNLSNIAGGRRANSPSSIDLRPFLDPADGGTGARLINSTTAPAQTSPVQTSPAQTSPAQTSPAPTGSRLNPGNFR